jgi:hypothetical protein
VLAAGTWGERGLRLDVQQDGSAVLLFECAHGRIPAPLSLGTDGSFSWNGVYQVEMGTETSGSMPGPELPATYSGDVAGDTLTIHVFVPGGFRDETFTLQRGHQGPTTTCISGQ